jgi:hypothetical protein
LYCGWTVLLGVLWIATVWPNFLMLFILLDLLWMARSRPDRLMLFLLLGLGLGGYRLARPSEACSLPGGLTRDCSDGYCPVDLMAGCLAVWPEAGRSSSRCDVG